MPTRHPRISVTKDPELAEALERVRAIVGTAADASLVREMALRGADGVLEDETTRRDRLDRLVRRTTMAGWLGMSPEELDHEAWGAPHSRPPAP